MSQRPTCPTPDKRGYYTRKDAGRHLRSVRRRWGSIAKGERTYLCACGRWHVGSSPTKQRSRKR